MIIETAHARQLHSPASFKVCSHMVLRDTLIAGKSIRRRADISSALHVVMPPQRIGSGSWAHVIAGDEQKIGDRGRAIRPIRMLGYPHCPEDAHRLCLSNFSGYAMQCFKWHAADL